LRESGGGGGGGCQEWISVSTLHICVKMVEFWNSYRMKWRFPNFYILDLFLKFWLFRFQEN